MSAKIAAYDSAIERAEADYWAWSHPGLSPEVRKQIFYDIIRNKPDAIEGADSGAIVGGFKTLERNECVAYRFFDGGRDSGGRPGRLVIVLAVAPMEELRRHDPMTLLRQLSTMATDMASGCARQPDHLEILPSGDPPVVTSGTKSLCHGRTDVELLDLEQAAEAFALAASRPECQPFEIAIDTRTERPAGRLRVSKSLMFTEIERGMHPSPSANEGQPPSVVAPMGCPQDVHPKPRQVSDAPVEFWSNYHLQRNILLVLVGLLAVITLVALLIAASSPGQKSRRTTGLAPGSGDIQTEWTDPQQKILEYIYRVEKDNPGKWSATDDIARSLFDGNAAKAQPHLERLTQDQKLTVKIKNTWAGQVRSYRLIRPPEKI